MKWKNTTAAWGVISRFLHWFSALMVFGLYGLGWYMIGLDYYDPWYRPAPFWHKSVGLLLLVIVAVRLLNRIWDRAPEKLVSLKRFELLLAHGVHASLYVLLLGAMVSGYLISTADGRSISFFGWFDVPALVTSIPDQEDVAGDWHIWLTDALVMLGVLHGLAALKHHFLDKDRTLLRMLRGYKK